MRGGSDARLCAGWPIEVMRMQTYVNVFRKGQQLPAGTPIAVRFYLDQDRPRIEANGEMREDGRLWITHDFPKGVGVNLEVEAVPGGKPGGPRHAAVGTEFVTDSG